MLRNHPWVFSGAISQIEGEPGPGDTVLVCDSSGKTLGFGAYSPSSQIRVRMWSFGSDFIPIEDIIRSRVARAIGLRNTLREQISSDAFRLIHAESDQLPGVIADQYGGVVVVQLLTTGAYHWRDLILEAISEETKCSCLVEKSDADVLGLEGLMPVVRVVHGVLPDELWITEHDLNFLVKPLEGQKTGFYMDQRENHHLVQQFSGGKRVLDCFSYTGGFGLNALKGGAESVEMVDSSKSALEFGKNQSI